MASMRQSNMELLRIFAMFLILIIHATSMSLGGLPTIEQSHNNFGYTHSFFFFYGLSSVGVNLFVLISGWFGIRPTLKSFFKLLFQVLFFTILAFCVLIITDKDKYLNLNTFYYVFLIPSNQLWFVKAYLVLMILAPVLNTFAESCSSRQLLKTIIAFYVFQTIYGWCFADSTPWIGGGYSPISFLGLYLTARYLRLYPQPWYRWGFAKLTGLFILIIFALALLSSFITYKGYPIAGRLYAYSSPFMICAAIILLIAFSRLKFQNNFINWVAISAFAVYLTHGNEIILRGYYAPFIGKIFNNNSGIVFILLVFVFMLSVFSISILLDKIRLYFWNIITKK